MGQAVVLHSLSGAYEIKSLGEGCGRGMVATRLPRPTRCIALSEALSGPFRLAAWFLRNVQPLRAAHRCHMRCGVHPDPNTPSQAEAVASMQCSGASELMAPLEPHSHDQLSTSDISEALKALSDAGIASPDDDTVLLYEKWRRNAFQVFPLPVHPTVFSIPVLAGGERSVHIPQHRYDQPCMLSQPVVAI